MDTGVPSDDHSDVSSDDDSSLSDFSLTSSPPPTPGRFDVQRPSRKSGLAEGKCKSLCENLLPIVGVFGPLLILSSFF